MKPLPTLTFLLFVFSSCSSGTTQEVEQTYRNYELTSEITHTQPFTGIVFWTDNEAALNVLGPFVQLEFSYMIPSQIVSSLGVYNWEVVEEKLDKAANRGHQCILRFRYTYPGQTEVSVPEYIINRPGYQMQFEQVEGMRTFIPDWSDPELKKFTMEFFQKFAGRYENDPRLAYLQVGFGSYAEYHLYDGPLQLGQTFPTKDYQEKFLNHIDALFDIIPWSISIDAASDTYSPMRSVPGLKNLDFGLFDDSFMHENHSHNDQEYNRACWLFFGENRWKTKVAGGEFSYYTQYDQEHVLDLPDGPHGRSFESFVDQYHMTYIIGNDQYNYQPVSRIKEAAQGMGYKFKVTSYRSNGVDTKIRIKNIGVAPLYYDAYPLLGNVSSSTSLKGLLPGNSKLFVVKAPIEGNRLTIKCKHILSTQEIQYIANLDGESDE